MDSKSTLSVSPLCPELDEELDELYVRPKLTIVKLRQKINNSNDFKGREIFAFAHLFQIGNLTNIYIHGNPGMGKSTYSKKLTLDWCNCVTDGDSLQDNNDTPSIADLKFVKN